MKFSTLSRGELEQRLANAEAALDALREGRVDSIVGKESTLVVKLHEAEERERQVKDFLMGIREAHQILLQEEKFATVLDRICSCLAGRMGFERVWIALLDERGQNFTGFHSRSGTRRTAALESRLLHGETPRCIRDSLSTPEPLVIDNPALQCPECEPGDDDPNTVDIRIRISSKEQNYGVMGASIDSRLAQDDEAMWFFRELADDLALAMQKHEVAARLRESHRRYQELFEGSRDGFVMVDCNGRFLDANPAFCRMLGYSLEELLDLVSFYDITPREIHEWERREIWEKRLLVNGESGLYEKEYIRRDGTVFPIEIQAYVVRDAEREIQYVWGMTRDVSERKQAQSNLLHSQKRLHHLLDASDSFAVQGYQEDGTIHYWNHGSETIYGHSRKEAEGKNILDLIIPPAMRNTVSAQIREMAQTRKPIPPKEMQLMKKDGSAVDVFTSHCVLEQPDGSCELFCIDVDLQEMKQLEAQQKLVLAAIDQLAESVVITDTKGTILQVNPAFTATTGYSRDEAVGRNIRMLDSGRQERGHFQRLWETIKSGKTWQGTFINRCKDGSLITEEATISPIFNDQGDITHFVAVKRDITEELATREMLGQAQKMESVGRLAGGVAHDFNNMLGVILGNVEIALDELKGDGAVRECLSEIETAAQRSASLTRQLLAFARRQTADPRPLNLNSAVESTLKLLRRLIGEDIELAWEPFTRLPLIRIDPAQVDQLLANLAVNARDAIGANPGKIHIATGMRMAEEGESTTESGRFVTLSFRDDGEGMDEETRNHAFEPFFTTKEEGKGTGLGLATIYGIVEQNNGRIRLESEPGRGTVFHLDFPALEDAVEDEQDDACSPPPPSLHHETILLLEDEPALLSLAEHALLRLGYHVLATRSTDKAWSIAKRKKGGIDLLVTDVIMPKTSGPDFAARIAEIIPDIKVLYISGYPAERIARHGIVNPGIHLLQKPFSRLQLARRIREILDAK